MFNIDIYGYQTTKVMIGHSQLKHLHVIDVYSIAVLHVVIETDVCSHEIL